MCISLKYRKKMEFYTYFPGFINIIISLDNLKTLLTSIFGKTYVQVIHKLLTPFARKQFM